MAKKKTRAKAQKKTSKIDTYKPIKLDLGCGANKVGPDWTGVDAMEFPGVNLVLNLVARSNNGDFKPWPWEDNSVEEVHCSHFIEHLDGPERIHFVNELYRVLRPRSTAKIIVPHWNSCRAYGDLTHKWPPVSEFWFYYLSKTWREGNAPHNTGYTCNFEATWGYSVHPALQVKNQEQQGYALSWFKEAAQDIIATFVKA